MQEVDDNVLVTVYDDVERLRAVALLRPYTEEDRVRAKSETLTRNRDPFLIDLGEKLGEYMMVAMCGYSQPLIARFSSIRERNEFPEPELVSLSQVTAGNLFGSAARMIHSIK